jgi:hypothetical protein
MAHDHIRSSQATGRRWITVFALLAFFLQGLVVQTHIHELAPALVVKTTSSHQPAPLKIPDPVDHCRLCQELVHAGALVTPSANAVYVSLIFIAAIFTALPAFAGTSAGTFAWQSRAPPRR